jgi:hypothetical protein
MLFSVIIALFLRRCREVTHGPFPVLINISMIQMKISLCQSRNELESCYSRNLFYFIISYSVVARKISGRSASPRVLGDKKKTMKALANSGSLLQKKI